jgi:murein DD-endopeptidase MepM/ murein hydrolase activator NlpD
MHPRQVLATEAAVYVLDRAGRRLLALDPGEGRVLAWYEFPDRRGIGAIGADPSGRLLILGGRDSLYFVGIPERQATVEGGPSLPGPQPHDLALLRQLRGLQMPVDGATITRRDFQMPGAPRHYRLGVHEGLDFYSHTVGVPVNRQTPVQAVAEGIVVRALLDYEPLTAKEAARWASEINRLGYTPAEVLDGYRGRQVWVDHGDGLISRYVHLSSIAPGVAEGSHIKQGQVIGTAGNSGTPSSITSKVSELHLHFELWMGDHYVGQFLRPIETREWLERVLR